MAVETGEAEGGAAGGRRRGRPRDESRDAAILGAALAVLAEVGYDHLTMDTVAARAHAGKGALYRRWPSKAELVIEAVKMGAPRLDVPDTGSLKGDLAVLVQGAEALADQPERVLRMAGLATAASHDPELAAALKRHMTPRDDVMKAVFSRAVSRGEIPPERDSRLIWELLPSILFARAIFSPASITPSLVRHIVDTVVYPLLTAPASPAHPN